MFQLVIILQCAFPKLKPGSLFSLVSPSPKFRIRHEVLPSHSSEVSGFLLSLYHSGPYPWPLDLYSCKHLPISFFTSNCYHLIWYNITLIFLKYHFDFFKSILKVDGYYKNEFLSLIYCYAFPWWSFLSAKIYFILFKTTSWYFMMWMYHKSLNYFLIDGI